MTPGVGTAMRYAGALFGIILVVGAIREATKPPATLTPEIWSVYRGLLHPWYIVQDIGIGLGGLGIIGGCLGFQWAGDPFGTSVIPTVWMPVVEIVGLVCFGVGILLIFLAVTMTKWRLRHVLTSEEYADLFAPRE